MVPVLARMSVIIKADHDTNIITGNYEMAYICGLFGKLCGKSPENEFSDPTQMHRFAMELSGNLNPEDEKEQNLIRMLKLYKPDNTFDDQVKELFEMGLNEKNLWKKLA